MTLPSSGAGRADSQFSFSSPQHSSVSARSGVSTVGFGWSAEQCASGMLFMWILFSLTVFGDCYAVQANLKPQSLSAPGRPGLQGCSAPSTQTLVLSAIDYENASL